MASTSDIERERARAAAWVRRATSGPMPELDATAVASFDALPPRAVAEVVVRGLVAPWVVAALDRAGRGEVATSSGLRAVATMQAMSGLRLDVELKGLAAQFAEQRIQCVLLKGPSVAHRYYPQPELRPYGDLDILIRERDEHRTHDVLSARGYEFASGETRDPLHHDHAKFQSTFKRPDGAAVDLHQDHLQIGLRPVSLDEAWARAVPSPWGANVRLLEDHDQFVMLAVHIQRHGYDRLLWFKDLDLMVRRGGLDWHRVAEVARLEGCLSSVAYALSLLRDVLGTPLPPAAAELANRRGIVAGVVQALLWPRGAILSLQPRRQFRLRRAMQFAPESGVLRGGLPGMLSWGRRGAKARVILAALTGRRPRPS